MRLVHLDRVNGAGVPSTNVDGGDGGDGNRVFRFGGVGGWMGCR